MNVEMLSSRAATNPYVGPRSFTTGQALYGREQEASDLVDLLVAERVVLLHSPSGAGKTSLINARLMPLLTADHFEVIPLARVHRELPPELPPAGRPLNRYVLSTMLSIEESLPPRFRKPVEDILTMTLDEYLDQWPDLDNVPGNEVLIFDQFEEIVTSDPTDLDAKREFFTQLGVALRDRSLWAMFAMREDFLAELDPYARLVPTRFATRYRLDLLGRDAALEAIVRPAADKGVTFELAAAERLVEDLSLVRVQRSGGVVHEFGVYVEPVQLQVVCLRAWNLLADGVTSIGSAEIDAIGDVDRALASYYADTMLETARATGVSERALRYWVEQVLVTRRGFRGQTSTGPHADHVADKQVLQALTEAHLLRPENRRGTTWYELAHDRLVDPVRSDNTRWRSENLSDLERRAELWDENRRESRFLMPDPELAAAESTWASRRDQLLPRERDFLDSSRQEQERAEKERRANIRTRRWLVIAVAVSTVALLLLGWVAWAYNELAEQRALAWSRLLAGKADQLVETQPDVAILAGLQSLSLSDEGSAAPPAGLVAALARVTHASQQLDGHSGPVYDVAFSPQAALLASAAADKTVRLWDTATGQPRGEPLRGHTGPVLGLAFSPDGALLATAGLDKTVRLWDAATGRPLGGPLLGHDNSVNGLAFSPDGSLLASAGADQTVRLWETATGRPHGGPLLGHFGVVFRVAFSPDGSLLASTSADETVRLWDTATGMPHGEPLRGHTNSVFGVAFNPDGTLLATTSADLSVRLWDPATGQPQGEPLMGHAETVFGVAFSPDGSLLATAGADLTVRLWDTATHKPRGQPLTGHTGAVLGAAFSPDGALLATAGADQTVRLWTVHETYSISQPLTGHTDSVTGVAYSPDDRVLATASADATVRMWDAVTGQPRGAPLLGHDGRVNGVAFSRNGDLLATVGDDRTVRLWDAVTGRPHGNPMTGHSDIVNAVAFSPDGTLLASASSDRTVRLWEVATGRSHGKPLVGHTDIVNGVAFSPDGRLISSVSNDQYVRLWDVASRLPHGQPLTGHTSYVHAVAFSPGGTLLATASADKTVRLWETATGQLHGHPLTGHGSSVFGVAFSPTSTLLATAGRDQTVRIWDVATGESHGQPVTGHASYVNAVAFNTDGSRLASASADRTVRLWNPSFTDWVGAGCRLVNRNLTQDEWTQLAAGLPYEKTCPNLPPGRGAPADAATASYPQ